MKMPSGIRITDQIRARGRQCDTGRNSDSAQTRLDTPRHGARANDRHVDAKLLTGLGALDEQTTRCVAERGCRDPLQHPVGSFRTFNHHDPPAFDHNSLSHIERRQLLDHAQSRAARRMLRPNSCPHGPERPAQ